MAAISISCPACDASLKITDDRLVGKNAKCPKCGHRFLVAVPGTNEVPLRLADVPVLPLAPQKGTSARWVPDDVPVFPQGSAETRSPVFPSPGPGQMSMPDASAFPAAEQLVSAALSPAASVPGIVAPNLDFSTPAAGASGSTTDRLVRRRRSSKTPMMLTVGAIAIVVLGGGFAVFFVSNGNGDSQTSTNPAVNPAWEEEKAQMAASNADAESLSPTSGENIPIDYLPFTPHLLCHLHPMDLWKKDRVMGEFQAMLGDVGMWLKQQIVTRTRFEPEDISELTFAVNFGSRMSEPDIAVVVRLREPQTATDLMKRFNGRMRPEPGVEVYDAEDFSFLLIDTQTFVVAPLSLSSELALSKDSAAMVSPDMEPLLGESDRDRHVTVIFDLKLLDSHREDVFLSQLQQVADKFILWFGPDAETVSWSMHLDPNLFMETLLHNTTASSVLKVQRHAQLQLSRLAADVLWGVKRMKPATVGSRQMIGRFPAMLQALDVATTVHVAPSSARLITILPQNAAANLAAGALLTWNQSLLTNFEDDTQLTKTQSTSIPEQIEDRLKMPVLVDFRNTPLQEAWAYIGDSIKTGVTIDGKALQGAGFTQVMPQTYNLGTVPALVAIDTILAKYRKERDPLVMVLDKQKNQLLLTTKVKAEADGLTPYDTSKR